MAQGIVSSTSDRARKKPEQRAPSDYIKPHHHHTFQGSSNNAFRCFVGFTLKGDHCMENGLRPDTKKPRERPMPPDSQSQSGPHSRAVITTTRQHFAFGRVGPGNFTPSLSQIRT